jgi:hypothetical protein
MQELAGNNRGKPNRAEIYEPQYPLPTGVRVVLGGWRPDACRSGTNFRAVRSRDSSGHFFQCAEIRISVAGRVLERLAGAPGLPSIVAADDELWVSAGDDKRSPNQPRNCSRLR